MDGVAGSGPRSGGRCARAARGTVCRRGRRRHPDPAAVRRDGNPGDGAAGLHGTALRRGAARVHRSRARPWSAPSASPGSPGRPEHHGRRVFGGAPREAGARWADAAGPASSPARRTGPRWRTRGTRSPLTRGPPASAAAGWTALAAVFPCQSTSHPRSISSDLASRCTPLGARHPGRAGVRGPQGSRTAGGEGGRSGARRARSPGGRRHGPRRWRGAGTDGRSR